MQDKTNNIRKMKRFILFLFCGMLFAAGCEKITDPDGAKGKSLTVMFDSNGGCDVEAITVKRGEKIDEPAAPTREDYVFDGWFTDNKTFANEWDFAEDAVTENVTLYAMWVIITEENTYTVTFDSNGGSDVEAITVKQGERIDEPAAPTRDDYVFDGWFTDNKTFANEWDFAENAVSENVTLYAMWVVVVENTFSVTFDSNGGSAVEAITVKQGEKIDEPATPTRDDYIFDGWFTDNETFTNKWNFTENVVTEDVTLYAKWNNVEDTDPDCDCPTPIARGTTGSLTWVLCSDGILTIRGKGEMPDYSGKDVMPDYYYEEVGRGFPPWKPYRDFITKVVIEDGVNRIGYFAFSNCTGLKTLTIPNTVSFIGYEAFYGCIGLKEIFTYSEMPPVLMYLHPFGDAWDIVRRTCTIFVPSGSEMKYYSSPGWGFFLKICAIGEEPGLVIDAGCGYNEWTTFLFSWRLYPDGTLIIGGNYLTGFHPRGGEEEFGYAPWCVHEVYRNSITSVLIGEGISQIDAYAFYNCANLTILSIPSTIIQLGAEKAFSGCTKLAKIINHRAHPQNISTYEFEDINKTECVLIVPAGSEEAYRTTEGWKEFVNIKAIQ
jgi:uncharacterized repeat protein (TIGR02543 family)